ncbi:peroxiredoxin [soil metagenome]
MTIEIGDEAPDFTLKNQRGQDVTLSSFRGVKSVVVIFYPFAFSGICTGELCEIRDNVTDFSSDEIEVLAVSCDPMFSLRAFAEKESYEFSLLSDFWPHGATAKTYDVFNETIGAALRGTFIIDLAGIVRWKVENGLPDARDIDAYRDALSSLN